MQERSNSSAIFLERPSFKKFGKRKYGFSCSAEHTELRKKKKKKHNPQGIVYLAWFGTLDCIIISILQDLIHVDGAQ